MAINAQYVATPKIGIANISTANAARDGSGTITTVLTGAVGGTRIDRISIDATATTTAGMIRFFISDTTAANTSANTHLYLEIPVTAVTPTATVQAFNKAISSISLPDMLPVVLPANYTLRVSTEKAENFRITVQGGDF